MEIARRLTPRDDVEWETNLRSGIEQARNIDESALMSLRHEKSFWSVFFFITCFNKKRNSHGAGEWQEATVVTCPSWGEDFSSIVKAFLLLVPTLMSLKNRTINYE